MKKIVFTQEDAYRIFVTFCFAFSSIRLFFGAIFTYFGVPEIGEALFYIVFLFCGFFSMRYYLYTIKLRSIILFIIWIIYLFFSAITTEMDTQEYVNALKYIAVFGGCFLLVGKSIRRNGKIVKSQLYKVPILLNLIGVMNYIILGRTGTRLSNLTNAADYSMELTYANLVSALICTIVLLAGDLDDKQFVLKLKGVKQKKAIFILNLILSYVLVLLGGSRGPVLTLMLIAVFSSTYSLMRKKNLAIVVFFISLCVLAGVLIFLNGDVISRSSIRFLALLGNSKLLSGSGREHYIQLALKGISENKLMGVGVFHDRIYIYKLFHRYTAHSSIGSYPHNIVLEILLQFGIPVGIILLFLLAINIIKAYKDPGRASTQEVFWFVFGLGMLPLLVSKSYTQTWEFYLLIGYIMESRQHIRLKNSLSL